MKHIIKLFLPSLFLLFASCGLIDSGGGNPDWQSHNIDRIYSTNLDGNGLKLITTGSNFSLLPNGKIIYIKDYKLYSCNSDGSDSLLLTPKNLSVYNYKFYLNGTKIILYAYPSLYSINLDGSGFNQFNLSNNISYSSSFVYSPNGQKLVYTNNTGLYIANNDGSNPKLIRDTTNRSYSYDISFTPDGNNIIYIQNIQGSVAIDLRLYNLKSTLDTSLFYNNDGNKAGSFIISPLNRLLFTNGDGINLLDLSTYKYYILYHGGQDIHFSYDSTKITFMNFNLNAIGIMDLRQNTANLILINLPKNFISNPILSLDGKSVIFQADTSWEVMNKKM